MSKVRHRSRSEPAAAQPAQPADRRQQFITPELRAWIVSQAQAGCKPEDVLKAMCDSGWYEDVAITAMEEVLAGHLAQQASATSSQSPPGGLAAAAVAGGVALAAGTQPGKHPVAGALPEPALADAPSQLWAGDREVKVLLTMALPRVVVLGDFLSEAECDELMALARLRLARSETVVNETGGSEVNQARTSDGMFFGRAENELCERIERRIAHLLNWPVERGEGLQVLRYRPGAEYKPHHDYFDPDQPGAPTILARGGQRVGTLVMYLNTPTKGGATTFPDVGLAVSPVKGNAVFFSYDRPEASTRTLHGGAPVIEGEKWVATKWMRVGVFA